MKYIFVQKLEFLNLQSLINCAETPHSKTKVLYKSAQAGALAGDTQ